MENFRRYRTVKFMCKKNRIKEMIEVMGLTGFDRVMLDGERISIHME